MRLLTLLGLALLALVGCGDDDDDPVEATTPTTEETTTTADDDGTGDSELADASVWLNDDALGIAGVCQGVDGAVVIDTVSGPRVMIVREQGLAIRISTGTDEFAESSAVKVARVGEVQRYEAEVRVDGDATEVRVEIRDDIESALDLCPELQP